MLHHVALEVRPEDAQADGRFWVAVGFEPVEPPGALGPGYDWFEREGTQIHLAHWPDPRIPARGHAAIVVDDFPGTLDRLREAGFAVSESRELWGEPRAKVTLPSGHTVELMAAPPAPGSADRASR